MNKQAIRNEIELLCKDNQECADNDMVLYAAIWKRHGWDDSKSLEENLRVMPTAANITRRRVELQKDGKIKPSEEATNRRFRAFVKERDEHSSYVPHDLERNLVTVESTPVSKNNRFNKIFGRK